MRFLLQSKQNLTAYDVLAVSPGAPGELISASYWRNASILQEARIESHEANFALYTLTRAYERISDPVRRSRYNEEIGYSEEPIATRRLKYGPMPFTRRLLRGRSLPLVDYFEVIGLAPGADPPLVEDAYRIMRDQYLRIPPGAKRRKELLALLREAHALLLDDERRAEYEARRNGGGVLAEGATEAAETIAEEQPLQDAGLMAAEAPTPAPEPVVLTESEPEALVDVLVPEDMKSEKKAEPVAEKIAPEAIAEPVAEMPDVAAADLDQSEAPMETPAVHPPPVLEAAPEAEPSTSNDEVEPTGAGAVAAKGPGLRKIARAPFRVVAGTVGAVGGAFAVVGRVFSRKPEATEDTPPIESAALAGYPATQTSDTASKTGRTYAGSEPPPNPFAHRPLPSEVTDVEEALLGRLAIFVNETEAASGDSQGVRDKA